MTLKQFQAIDVFVFSGNDHLDFFKNQIISDFDTKNTHIQYSAICNPKGRVIFSLLMQHQSGDTWVAVDGSLGDNFLQYVNMRRFRMAMDVKKTDRQLSIDSNSMESGLNAFNFNHQATEPPAHDAFWAAIFGLKLPWITTDSTEQHIPQHLNMDQADIISFTKGCYPGQEIVARLHYLGQVKKRIQVIEYQANQPAQNGSKVQIPGHEKTVELCSDSVSVSADLWQAQAMMSQ